MFKKELKEDALRDIVNDLVFFRGKCKISKKQFGRPPKQIKLGDISSDDEIKLGDVSLDDEWILEGS